MSTDPADGATVDEITGVTFTFPSNIVVKDWNICKFINESGEEVRGDFVKKSGDNSASVKLTNGIFENGRYQVVFPANTAGDQVWADNQYREGTGVSNPEFSIYINVSGKNNLEPITVSPEPGDILDYHGTQDVRLTFDQPVYLMPDAKAKLMSNVQDKNPMECSLSIDKDDNKIVVVTIGRKLSANNANYRLVVPAGVISNRENGEGTDAMFNKELKYSYKTSIGDVFYDITFTVREPKNAQSDNSIGYIELEASMDWNVFIDDVLDKVFIYKHDTTEKATTITEFTFDKSPGSMDYRAVQINFKPALTEKGQYDLVIPQGVLGDSEWYLGKEGYSNAAQTIIFTVGKVDSIDDIFVNEDVRCNVYNVYGMIVARDADKNVVRNLNPGIYIINGKKFIVR